MIAAPQVRQAVADAVEIEHARNSLVALLGWPNGGMVAAMVEVAAERTPHRTAFALELCRVFLLRSPEDMLGREPRAIFEAFAGRFEEFLP